MKNLTSRLSLFALVLLVVSSCKPKLDMDFVNSLIGSQTKITETIDAFTASNKSMETASKTFAAQADEMMKADPNSGASGLMSQITSLMGNRGSLLKNFAALTPMITGLISKYKGGDLKIKDAKSQFEEIQGKLNGYVGEAGKSDKMFGGLKGKFMDMFQAYQATKK